jgi:hypothetical protein
VADLGATTGAAAFSGLGGLASGFLAVSKVPLANSMTWPSWISQCKSPAKAVCSGAVSGGVGGGAVADGAGGTNAGARASSNFRRVLFE